MFGINDTNTNPDNVIADGQSAPVHEPAGSISPAVSSPFPQSNPTEPTTENQNSVAHFSSPAQPFQTTSPAEPPAADNQPASDDSPVSDGDDKLLNIKQQALTSLTPLLGHLEQSPEEKFRTTMMLIQASDNSELLGEAYAAANLIEDEKVRANALLDVVNEINYFTHHQNKTEG